MGRLLAVLLAALAFTGTAAAHAPTTAIGRASRPLGTVPVSYDPGAMVSDVEATDFGQLVGAKPNVAFMPRTAERGRLRDRVRGGARRNADRAGGSEVGRWSDEIGDGRLAQLVADATVSSSGESLAVPVGSLVRSIRAEPVDSGLPWGWIAAGLLAVALGGLLAFDLQVSRRP